MSVKVIVGTQWGDEGKGKITDILAEKMDYVVRYQGVITLDILLWWVKIHLSYI